MKKNCIKHARVVIKVVVLASVLGGCVAPAAQAPSVHVSGASLRFIGEQRLPWRQQFMGTTVGGLSGLDYDPASGTWIMESDDRSDINPARFYNARLDYDESAFRSVTLTGMYFFQQADGTHYPNAQTAATQGGEVPDIESIRFDPRDASIWYASEGSRNLGFQPFVRHATAKGKFLDTLTTPELFKVWPQREYGVRDNFAFEGISFAPDGQSLWLALESSLYQDGPLPTLSDGAVSRITHLDRKGTVLAQYAYRSEPNPPDATSGKRADNGISEILAVDERHVYVIERAGVLQPGGAFRWHIRLFEFDTEGATDIQHFAALEGRKYIPVRKRQLLDLADLPLGQVDNIEGVAWGRRLVNGHDTLVMVSDDNFARSQVTQLLLFEVLPK